MAYTGKNVYNGNDTAGKEIILQPENISEFLFAL